MTKKSKPADTTAANAEDTSGGRGIVYLKQIVGKYLFRVRQIYVADQVAPMLAAGQVGAAKLDLVLRGLALLPEHAGARPAGFVLRRGITYEDLHDLCRDPDVYTKGLPEEARYEPAIVEKKRAWVAKQLRVLEARNLVRRTERPGRRPDLTVLRDDGVLDDDGEVQDFDDPGPLAGKQPGNAYITIHGHVMSDSRFRNWSAGELAAYLCAMTAERFDTKRPTSPGTGTWFRQIAWFGGAYRDNTRQITYPFGERTLRDGFQNLAKQDFLRTRDTNRFRGQRFGHPRRIYTNRFGSTAASNRNVIDFAAFLADHINDDDDFAS